MTSETTPQPVGSTGGPPEPRKPLISQRALLLLAIAVGVGFWAADAPAVAPAITAAVAVLVLLHDVTER